MAREFPCCLCPGLASDFKADICGICDFVKKFRDSRGWVYFVRGGMGANTYKAFYTKPDSKKQKGCTMVPYRDTFRQAQIDLNALAKSKGWEEL